MAYAPTGSLWDKKSNQIQEILNKSITELLPAQDPIFRDVIKSSLGVQPITEWGRDYKIIRIFTGAFAGVSEIGDNYNNVAPYGDNTISNVGAKLMVESPSTTWPSINNSPSAQPYRLGVGMRSEMTNLPLTMAEAALDATPALIGQVIAPKLRGHMAMLAHKRSNYFYLSENDNFKLGTLGTVSRDQGSTSSAHADGTPAYSVRSPVSNMATDRFAVGMNVDIYNSAMTVRVNESGGTRIPAYISAVDEVVGEITISGIAADPYGATAPASGQVVVYANSYATSAFKGLPGINSWMKKGGATNAYDKYLLGSDYDTSNAVDVTTHPEHKSAFVASVGTLTENLLLKYLDMFDRSKRKYGYFLDFGLFSDGLARAYLSTKIGQYQIQRGGGVQSLNDEGEEEGFTIMHNGRKIRCYTSNSIDIGTAYFHRKGGNNWRMAVPPKIPGTQQSPDAEPGLPFEFVGTALGYASQKVPVSRTISNLTSPTIYMQLPGVLRFTMIPWLQVPGLKLTGCDTDRVFGDTLAS